MNFVNEEHLYRLSEYKSQLTEYNTYARNDLSFSLLSPFGDLLVNLIPEFRLDLTGVASEECKEPLCSTVDDVNFV